MKNRHSPNLTTNYRKFGIAALVLLLAGLGVAASWRTRSEAPLVQEDRYELRGVVKSVAPAKKRATIKHEKVGELMEPMTMPFLIKDAKALKEMKPDDQIKATLVVTDDGGQWLEKITIIKEPRG